MFEVTLSLADDSPLDLTPYVTQLSVQLGVFAPIGGMASVGVCRITLDNSDRRFTPNNVASPYWHAEQGWQLTPNRRVEVKVDGVRLFVGRLRRISIESGLFGNRHAHFECEDQLGALQAAKLTLPLQENKRADALIHLILARAFRTGVARGLVGYKAFSATQVAENDTVTIDGVTYRFKEAPSQINDVKRTVPTDRFGQMENLMAAINGAQGEGTKYYPGTQRPPNVIAAMSDAALTVWLRSWNPVRYYRLDEGVGSTATDLGENRRDAAYVNSPTLGVTLSPVFAEDPRTCVTLNGLNQRIDIPIIDLSKRSFSFHIMFRADPISPPTAQTVLSAINATYTQPINLRLYNTGTLEMVVGSTTITMPGAITFGQWYRIIVAFDYHAQTLKVWRYEDLIGEAACTGLSDRMSGFTLASTAWLAEHFKGDLAEFALYLRPDLFGFMVDEPAPPRLNIHANTNGAWANGIHIHTTSAALGTRDLHAGTDHSPVDFEAGQALFHIAADQWHTDSTNALSAIEQVVESENGLFWQARDGKLVFKNRDWWLRQAVAPTDAADEGAHNAIDDTYGLADIYNRIVVSYTPRRTLTSGVVAQSNQVIRAAGRWGRPNKPPQSADRFSIAQELPPRGITTVKLPFVDLVRGRIAAAKNLRLPPEPYLDYTANTRADGTGEDYTAHPLHPDVLRFSVARSGADIELTIENTALGTLFIRDLQLRGEAVVAYEPVQYVREDSLSILRYGVRELAVELPLTSSQLYAESLAEYLLGRYKQPAYRLARLKFRNQGQLGTVRLVDIDIGSVLSVSDTQLGIAGQRYLVTGLRYELDADKRFEVEFAVRPLEDVTFWLLGDATYGRLNETTRLGV
ncbi:MAG: hypothetical protein SNJ58_12865 [Aggregatilineales bacterium]